MEDVMTESNADHFNSEAYEAFVSQEVRPMEPRKFAVALGIFLLRESAEGMEVERSWPSSMSESGIAKFLARGGFCPTPSAMASRGVTFVLSFREMVYIPRADPLSMLYACMRVTHPDESGAKRAFCLVSKFPLFDMHFSLLNRAHSGQCPGDFLEPLDLLGIDDLLCSASASAGALQRLQKLQPVLSPPQRERLLTDRMLTWAVGQLCDTAPHLLGDPLLRLLSAALQEKRILLVGADPQVNAMSLTLRAALHPFRWLHLFLSAPVPEGFGMFDLHSLPFPMIASVRETPDVADDLIVADLAPAASSCLLDRIRGCLGADRARLLQGSKVASLPQQGSRGRELGRLRQRLRHGQLDRGEAVGAVVMLLRGVVEELAASVRQYMDETSTSTSMGPEVTEDARYARICHLGRFQSWLGARRSADFYERFFETQLCVDFMSRELPPASEP